MSAGPRNFRRSRRGFTLVELLISLSLVMMLTLALLTSYVFIVRGDRSLQDYGEMSGQSRLLLDQLGADLRGATDVSNFTANALTLSVPTNLSGSTTQDVVWEFNSANNTVTRRDNVGEQTVARGVQSFSFYYTNSSNVQTTSLIEVKQVQVNLRMQRSVASTTNSQNVVSAQFTMRAKSTAH